MKRIVGALVGGLLIGAYAASNAQPKPAAKADPEKAAMEKAIDKAVANYKKNKAGGGMAPADGAAKKK